MILLGEEVQYYLYDCFFLLPAFSPRSGFLLSFLRGMDWPSSVSLRELGRLHHSVELVPNIRRADRGIVSRAKSRGTRGRCQPIFVIRSSILDHDSYQYQRVAR